MQERKETAELPLVQKVAVEQPPVQKVEEAAEQPLVQKVEAAEQPPVQKQRS